MKERVNNLLNEISKLMQGHLAKREFDSVTQLSTLLSRVQQLQKRVMELEGEVSEIETSLKGNNGNNVAQTIAELVPQLAAEEADAFEARRASPQTLCIEVDWKANGRQHDNERILFPKAGDGMVEFLSRICEERGQDVLQKLSRLRINRGPLLSKSPATDFLNQSQGKVYGHKRLRGTDYYVLTHSQTSQKVEDLNRICRVLGLAPGSVQIRAVDRSDCYLEKYV